MSNRRDDLVVSIVLGIVVAVMVAVVSWRLNLGHVWPGAVVTFVVGAPIQYWLRRRARRNKRRA
jgi:Flp pilus assembly protein TadB